MTRLVPLVLFLLLIASPALAQRTGKGRPEGRSPEQVKKRLTALFDKNDDGRLDRRELAHARRALRALRPEGRRGEAAPGRERSERSSSRPKQRRGPRGDMKD